MADQNFDSGSGAPAEPQATDPINPQAPAAPVAPTDSYGDIARQIEVFKEVKKQCLEGRTIFERAWWRVLMYLLRRQWIYYDTKRTQWRDKRLAKWMPRPTNTKMNEAQQTLRSMFASIQLGVVCRPNGTDPMNATTAEVADQMEPLIQEDHDNDAMWRDADFWLTALGNVVLHPWWDAERGDAVMLPEMDCPSCGFQHAAGEVDPEKPICQACNTPGVVAVPGTETPVPVGKGRTDVCSPLEILIPSGYTDWSDVRELIRARWRTKSYYEANFPELVQKIEWQKTPQERSIQLLKALASQSDLAATPFMSGGGDMAESEGVVEYEMWLKATPEFPQGYIGRFVGESENPVVIEDPSQSLPGPIPYQDKQGRPLWHWIHMGYDTFGGRLWSQGPMEGLVPLIDKLNRLDARIELIVDRMSNPIWLEPKGAEVERITGEPGIVIKYQSLGANMGKPERLDGMNIPQSLFSLREQYMQDIENAVGTHDVLQGQRPPNVEAFSAMQLLAEQGQKRFTSVFKERGRGYREWYKLALEMERDFGQPERTLATLGPNRTWSFQIFKKTDLQGGVTMIVEDGSTVPKTALGKRAAIDHANQLKAINPQDPDQNHAVMSELGLKHLIPRMDKAISSALREQHLYEEWVKGGRAGAPSPLIRFDYVDDDPVHAAQHKMWASSDAIRDLMISDPQAMQEIQMHIWMHVNGAFQQQMTAQMAAGKGGPGGPVPPGGPGGAHGGGENAAGAGQTMRNSNRESANPGDAGGHHQVAAA